MADLKLLRKQSAAFYADAIALMSTGKFSNVKKGFIHVKNIFSRRKSMLLMYMLWMEVGLLKRFELIR